MPVETEARRRKLLADAQAIIDHKRTVACEARTEPTGVGESLRNLMHGLTGSSAPESSALDGTTLTPEQVKTRAAKSNLPLRHELAQLRTDDKAPGKWKKTLDDILNESGRGYLISLLGNRGTGKTQIASKAMLHRIAIGRTTLYVKAMEIFLWIRRTYSDDSLSELDAIAEFVSPSLLVIDEIQVRGESEFENNMLTYIVDKRYDAMKDTLIIGNVDPDEFRASLGPSITSRLEETGWLMICNWDSFRKGRLVDEVA